jgi:hypothetical protein
MAKTKKNTSLYDYLHDTGVLESGDEELVKKVKAAYWRNYHKQYKREKRGKDREYSISLTKSERKHFESEATNHGKSVSMFLKDAAWAYIHNQYLNPDKADLMKALQILSRCYTDIERISHEGIEAREIRETLGAVAKIEEKLDALFSHPASLEKLIEHTMKEKPCYLNTLKNLIANYDNQVEGKKIEDGH